MAFERTCVLPPLLLPLPAAVPRCLGLLDRFRFLSLLSMPVLLAPIHPSPFFPRGFIVRGAREHTHMQANGGGSCLNAFSCAHVPFCGREKSNISNFSCSAKGNGKWAESVPTLYILKEARVRFYYQPPHQHTHIHYGDAVTIAVTPAPPHTPRRTHEARIFLPLSFRTVSYGLLVNGIFRAVCGSIRFNPATHKHKQAQ